MKTQIVATKAIIVEDSKVLVIRRASDDDLSPGLWDVPGGKLEWGEEPTAGLIREAMEETGLQIEVGQPWNIWHFIKADGETQVVGLTYICKRLLGEIRLSPEHTEFKWASLAQMHDLPMHPDQRDEIVRWMER